MVALVAITTTAVANEGGVRFRTHSPLRRRLMVVSLELSRPSMQEWPSQDVDDIGAMLAPRSGLIVLSLHGRAEVDHRHRQRPRLEAPVIHVDRTNERNRLV